MDHRSMVNPKQREREREGGKKRKGTTRRVKNDLKRKPGYSPSFLLPTYKKRIARKMSAHHRCWARSVKMDPRWRYRRVTTANVKPTKTGTKRRTAERKALWKISFCSLEQEFLERIFANLSSRLVAFLFGETRNSFSSGDFWLFKVSHLTLTSCDNRVHFYNRFTVEWKKKKKRKKTNLLNSEMYVFQSGKLTKPRGRQDIFSWRLIFWELEKKPMSKFYDLNFICKK